MAVVDFIDWLDDLTRPDAVWYAKRLAANDTLATGAHQAGPYVPRQFLLDLFPSLDRPGDENPDKWFDLYIDSDADHRRVRAVWYNNRLRGGTRNETRLTNFGGEASALLDPDSTGALAILAFIRPAGGDATECHAWVCRTAEEEDLAEDRIGPVEPGRFVIWSVTAHAAPPPSLAARADCRLAPHEIPPAWLATFPTAAEIIARTIDLRPDTGLDPDERLLRRRDCEYEIFLSVEEAVELPAIRAGFASVEAFARRAHSILQRRRSRSGRSLELHARAIFLEEGLVQGVTFAHNVESEPGRRPDFLFPSQDLYRDPAFPASRLRMLAAKTTCKDRWRQILNEATRVPVKHLLTLQEGVSAGQFKEMQDSGVQLVVPAGLVAAYPATVRPNLVTLESFIADVRLLTI